jgi:hypothetical protein
MTECKIDFERFDREFPKILEQSRLVQKSIEKTIRIDKRTLETRIDF